MKHNALGVVFSILESLKGKDGREGQAKMMNRGDVQQIERILIYTHGNLNMDVDLEEVCKIDVPW